MPKGAIIYDSEEETDFSLLDILPEDIYAPDRPCLITGTLDLWNGSYRVRAVESTLARALARCTRDDGLFVVVEEEGDLHVILQHHDGSNHFLIRFLAGKGQRSYAARGCTSTLEKPGYTSRVHLSKMMEEGGDY